MFDEKTADIIVVDDGFVVKWHKPDNPHTSSFPPQKTTGTKLFTSKKALMDWLKDFV